MKVKPQFYYGFELEGAYKMGTRNKLSALLTRHYGLKKAKLTHDGSVGHFYDSHIPIEIQTPPLPEEESFDKLLSLLTLLKEVDFQTNKTCGLHVNVSEKGLFFKAAYSRNKSMQNFCFHFAKGIDIDRWRKAFDRQECIWCRWDKEKEKAFLSSVEDSLGLREYKYAISFYGLRERKHRRRIELRMAGNTNYHDKGPLLKNYLNHIRAKAYLAFQKYER